MPSIPETRAMLARPIWRRCLKRSYGHPLEPPTDEEKRDAIAILGELEPSPAMLSVDWMMLHEATRILDEYGH